MARVLLINPNTFASPYPVYPLGLSYIAAALDNAGHRVKMVDFSDPDADVAFEIETFAPDYIGMSIRNIDDVDSTSSRFLAAEAVALAHRIQGMTTAPLIVGGSGFSIFPEALLDLTGADFGICGEGETAMPALIQALQEDGPHEQIPGLVFRSGGGIVGNPGTPLANAPIPLRPEPVVRDYLRGSSMLNLQTQRGCPFQCCYCSYPVIEGCRTRRFDPRLVAQDMEELVRMGVRYTFIVDSVFNTTEDHVVGICEEIIRKDIRMEWGCFLRPAGISREMATLMARAGARHVEFGSDSFCDTVLQRYGKGFCFDQIAASHEQVLGAGIHAAHFLILGGPGETLQTIDEGERNSRCLAKTVLFPFSGMRIYPGTALSREVSSAAEPANPQESVFYFSPETTPGQVNGLLASFRARSPRWQIGPPGPEALQLMSRLRSRGSVGPLWEYLAC